MKTFPKITDHKAVSRSLQDHDLQMGISAPRMELMCLHGVGMLSEIGLEGPLLEGTRMRLSISLPIGHMAFTLILIYSKGDWFVSDIRRDQDSSSYRMDVSVIPGKIGIAHMEMEARNNPEVMQKYLGILIRNLTERYEIV